MLFVSFLWKVNYKKIIQKTEYFNEDIGIFFAYYDIQYYKFYIILQNIFMTLTFMKS